MRGSQFRARALREAKRYGDDHFVFFRELAQNSRDAGASQVTVTTRVDEQTEWVVFEDDGTGMTFAHARAYLFRLYASSKESDGDAAGTFGVGFWSVLRWEPEQILIESRTRRDAWGARLDAELCDVQSVPCTLERPGTRVTLGRPRRCGSGVDLAREIRAGVRRYCRYLRRSGRGFEELPVLCDGVSINEKFAVDGPFSLAFSTRDVEGVVGLGIEPRVELYARGLLVTTASVLEEIEPGATVTPRHKRVAGMAPVILINSNDLDVVLSRKAPVRGRALERVVRIARARLHRLVGRLVDGACPSPWWERLADRGEELMRLPVSRLASVVVATSLLALAALAVLVTIQVTEPLERSPVPMWPRAASAGRVGSFPGVVVSTPPTGRLAADGPGSDSLGVAPAAEAARLPYANLSGYAGATVDVPDADIVPWGLTYDGPRDVLFRALALDSYDPEFGWLRGESRELFDYPEYRCRRRCISVRLDVVAPSEPLVVPMPTGTRLERETVRFAGEPVDTVYGNELGEALVLLAAGRAGILEYVVGPGRPDRRPAVDPPGITMPAWIERKVAQLASTRNLARRARLATQIVRSELDYDVSPEAARAFATAPGDWLTRVMSTKAGDCDVKNGVNVLLLRRLGIPARMAVGIAARDGTARPNLHAWTEYYANGKGWQAVDATGISRQRRRPVVASLSRAPEAGVAEPTPDEARGATEQEWSSEPTFTEVTGVEPAGAATNVPVDLSGPARRAPALAAALLLLGFGLLGWRLLGDRVRENIVADGDAAEQQRVLATMLHDALAHPDAWRSVASLWRRRVLPTLRGRKMSVADALRRAIDGGLFVSRERSDLARLAAARRTPVLDGADPVFGRVVSALGRTVDLDALSTLRPNATGGVDVTGYQLDGVLGPVNSILRQVTGGVECRVCPSLRDAPIRDVDLATLNLPRRSPWPRRFVAVNPRDPEVRRRARLLARDPGRGVFVWIDWLLDRSQILSRDATRLRERAAAELLEEVA